MSRPPCVEESSAGPGRAGPAEPIPFSRCCLPLSLPPPLACTHHPLRCLRLRLLVLHGSFDSGRAHSYTSQTKRLKEKLVELEASFAAITREAAQAQAALAS